MNTFHRYILLTALIVYAITAWYSVGYFHPDEHYQIIEFARLKQGLTAPSEMAWEYEAKIRPSIQPVLCLLIFDALKALTITDPYNMTFVLRLLSACAVLFSITLFVKTFLHYFQGHFRHAFIFLSYFLFLLPMISVRFSSETWSAVFMILALVCCEKSESRRNMFLVGIFMGLSFWFRFQSLFFSGGILLWLLWKHKHSIPVLLPLVAASLLVLMLGYILDSWFYGESVFTFWNYFDYNIVKGVASTFGVAPWYNYFGVVLYFFGMVPGTILLLLILYYLYKAYNQALVWAFISFVLVHCMVAHKEGRFLFPIVYFLPFIIVYALQDLNALVSIRLKTTVYKSVVVLSVIVAFTLNTLVLSMISLTPMHHVAAISFYIHRHYAKDKVVVYSYHFSPLYNLTRKIPLKHFVEENIKNVYIKTINELPDSIAADSLQLLVVSSKYLKNNPSAEVSLDKSWKKEMHSLPSWIQWVKMEFPFLDKTHQGAVLYRKW